MADKNIKPHISVIMPAYNAEKFISAASESILAQSYENLSLIIVNDGSTDSTAQIAAELSKKDRRACLITVNNGGPANARNSGLDAALLYPEKYGLPIPDYIMFCDADDEYLPDAFERAVSSSEEADIVFMGFTIVNPDGTKNDYFEPDAAYTPDTVGKVFPKLYTANLLNQVWGKLFKAALIRDNGFRFPDYRWGEDRLFIYDCLEKSQRISVMSNCGYLYKMYNSASLISGYYDRKPEVCIISDKRVRELCGKFNVEDDSECRYMFLKSVFSCLTNLYSPSCRISKAEKRAYAGRILENGYIKERIKSTGGGSAAKLISGVLSSGSVSLSLFTAGLLTKMSSAAPLLFEKIKHRK